MKTKKHTKYRFLVDAWDDYGNRQSFEFTGYMSKGIIDSKGLQCIDITAHDFEFTPQNK